MQRWSDAQKKQLTDQRISVHVGSVGERLAGCGHLPVLARSGTRSVAHFLFSRAHGSVFLCLVVRQRFIFPFAIQTKRIRKEFLMKHGIKSTSGFVTGSTHFKRVIIFRRITVSRITTSLPHHTRDATEYIATHWLFSTKHMINESRGELNARRRTSGLLSST